MLIDDMKLIITYQEKFDFYNGLTSTALRTKMQEYIEEYENNYSDIKYLDRIEIICQILIERTLS